MIYLMLSIIFSSLIPIIFKVSEEKGLNRYVVTSFNYVMAITVSFIISINKGLFSTLNYTSFQSFKNEFIEVIVNNTGIFSVEASTVWALIVGCSTGIFFCTSFIQYQKSIKESGISLSNIFLKMSILIPIAISIFLWKEYPNRYQTFGMILCAISIVIINIDFNQNYLKSIKPSLLLLLLYGGIGGFSTKIYQKYALIQYKDLLLFFIFTAAFLVSLIYIFKEKRDYTKYDVITGLLVGIPNLFTSFFMVLALNYINTSTAYLLSSAGSIVLVLIVGVLIFKEKLATKEKIAILITIIALGLINA